MTGISLCMLVRDEAANLAKSLPLVRPLVNELVVCDTGSADNTIEIAKSFGARVLQHVWKRDFAEARNYALSQVTTDYVLAIDADECVSVKDHQLLRVEMQTAMGLGGSLCLAKRNYTNKVSVGFVENPGTHPEDEVLAGYFTMPATILFPASARYAGAIHENVIVDAAKLAYSAVPLHHWAQVNQERQAKKSWYWDAAVEKLRVEGDGFLIRCEMGAQAMRDGDFENAVQQWARAVSLAPKHSNIYGPRGELAGLSHPKATALVNLSSAMFKLGKFNAAKRFAYQAQTLNKTGVDVAHNCAGCELMTGNPEKCALICMGILKYKPGYKPAIVLATIARACMTGRSEGLVELRKIISTVDSVVGVFIRDLKHTKFTGLTKNLEQALEGSKIS